MAESTPTAQAAPNPSLAVKRSWVRVLIFGIITGGLYYAYWFYVTRKQVDAELGDERTIKQSPMLQLFAPLLIIVAAIPLMFILIGFLLIPVAIAAGIYIMYALIKDMSDAAKKIGAPEISVPLVIVLQIFTGLGTVLAQDGWNKYWDKKTNGQATESRYTGGEIAVVALGVLFWVAYFVLIVALSVLSDGATNNVNDFNTGSYSFE